MKALSSFARNRSANVFMISALCILPLAALAGVSLDLSRAHNTKAHIQTAMDAAVLWAARDLTAGKDEDATLAKAKQVFVENIETRGLAVTCSEAVITVDTTTREVNGEADCVVPLTLAAVISSDDLNVDTRSQAVYGGEKIEIALMLDVSGSMRGQRLTDLKAASRTLIDTLIPVTHVGDVRISLVPYATSINAGSYGDVVTGITDLFAHTISNLGADPNMFVAAMTTGDTSESFDLVDAVGNTGLGSLPPEFFACAQTADPIPLSHPSQFICETRGGDNVGNDGCSQWSTSGTRLDSLPASAFPVRASTHLSFYYNDGNEDGELNCLSGCAYAESQHMTDYTYEDIHGGTVPADCVDGGGTASQTSTDWQTLDWTAASMAYSDYDFSVLGATHEANLGATSCVTDRGGSEAFTDASPITYPVGAASSACPGAPIEPLTHNKTILHDAIDSLHADGWTAGHLGIAWTWYTLSTDWSAVWPFNRRTEAGGTETVKRYAVLMTDGSFNTYYESGQGDSPAQARSLCTAMKADGITIFSVAFNAPPAGQSVLSDCATSSDTYFEASSGAELLTAYEEIASSVSNVRLTR